MYCVLAATWYKSIWAKCIYHTDFRNEQLSSSHTCNYSQGMLSNETEDNRRYEES